MLTVATVYKEGGDYNPEYVERLARGVKRHLRTDHRFLCLTDDPGEFDRAKDRSTASLLHGWPGWWSKLEVFALKPPVLFFDLDTVIVGSLDPLAAQIEELNGSVGMLRDFYTRRWASGVMGWASPLDHVLEDFKAIAPAGRFRGHHGAFQLEAERLMFHGDQNYLEHAFERRAQHVVALQDLVRGIYSYKVDVRQKRGQDLPADAAVICFHGRPRPHDLARGGGPAWFRGSW